ncbi:MAG TPA: formylglycine-generating enzyme family protein [Gallionellaceae bacterium]|nr:formylglycine-generating enzyme family protein [Gallionellaceae bacterium]
MPHSTTSSRPARHKPGQLWRQAVGFAALCWLLQAQAVVPGNTSKPISTFRDCRGCPEMTIIPAGSFNMGSGIGEVDREDDEGPVHKVRIAAFALGKTEITRGQFAAFVKSTKYKAIDKCWTLENGNFEERSGRHWRDLGFLQDDTHPVACINRDDAKAYAKWLSRKTGKHYRLPTEAEWEYAARANTRTARFWGNDPAKACAYANVADKTAEAEAGASSWSVHECTDGYAYTAPAGHFRANRFGLHDMLGSLWEWTGDNYHEDYTGASFNGKARQDKGTKYVMRGGSWNNGPTRVRAAKRGQSKPTDRFSTIGFRVARTLP